MPSPLEKSVICCPYHDFAVHYIYDPNTQTFCCKHNHTHNLTLGEMIARTCQRCQKRPLADLRVGGVNLASKHFEPPTLRLRLCCECLETLREVIFDFCPAYRRLYNASKISNTALRECYEALDQTTSSDFE